MLNWGKIFYAIQALENPWNFISSSKSEVTLTSKETPMCKPVFQREMHFPLPYNLVVLSDLNLSITMQETHCSVQTDICYLCYH